MIHDLDSHSLRKIRNESIETLDILIFILYPILPTASSKILIKTDNYKTIIYVSIENATMDRSDILVIGNWIE